jgi:DNA modification methylase
VKWYPYYAGFSPLFVRSVLLSAGLQHGAKILDPWNGSGTTTATAVELGYRAQGFDLNPVMVVVAKARLLSTQESPSLSPIASEILKKAKNDRPRVINLDEPLTTWVSPDSAVAFRKIEQAIQLLLVDSTKYEFLSARDDFEGLSDLAAFYYTALFRVARKVLRRFFASNPTWVKKPEHPSARIRPSFSSILALFKAEVDAMISLVQSEACRPPTSNREVSVSVASSSSLPVHDNCVDLVLTSPPYCTRIDYAVATMIELAVLGYAPRGSLEVLRRQLIGTSTVPATVPDISSEWGETCRTFLQKVNSHTSKASTTYYLKSHVQYFASIDKSLAELSRVLKPGGKCVLVAQDSYYKDVHNNLPRIITEMGAAHSLKLVRRANFCLARTMAGVNPAVRPYRNYFGATESVLWLRKQSAR